jgi:hypothetical protein
MLKDREWLVSAGVVGTLVLIALLIAYAFR